MTFASVIVCRRPAGLEAESPLIIWRQAVCQKFATLLTERGLITSAAMPDFLLEALSQGNLAFPDQLVLVGMETPAPGGAGVAGGGGPVSAGDPGSPGRPPGRGSNASRAWHFPTGARKWSGWRPRSWSWPTTRACRCIGWRLPPQIWKPTCPTCGESGRNCWARRSLQTGGAYNFSLGPTLAETPLFQAALLPLQFLLSGEQRQDLIGWLRSPFYSAFRRHDKTFLRWDLAWRECGRSATGWDSCPA